MAKLRVEGSQAMARSCGGNGRWERVRWAWTRCEEEDVE